MKNLVLKYSVEFIVIVLGISISFYVENYSENKKKDDLKNQSLNRIFQNIEFDIGDNIFNYKIHNGALNSAYWLIKNKKNLSNFSRDTIGYYFSKAIDEVTYFVDNQEEYRTLQNSGYMELIDNEELVKNLQEKYSSHNFTSILPLCPRLGLWLSARNSVHTRSISRSPPPFRWRFPLQPRVPNS